MDLETLRSFLMWCSIFNYGILLLWLVLLSVGRHWMMRVQARWFPISEEKFIVTHYLMYGGYKLAIVIFNLVPFIALSIMNGS